MLLTFAENSGIRPPALELRPEMTEVQRYYLDCYTELSKCRRYTESGPLPLSIAEIRDYCEVFDIDNFEHMFGWIKQIDDIWLDEVAKQAKKAQNKPVTVTETAPTPKRGG